ncbi:hypothetical protein [Paraburkholderia rhizosphaerae]|uniref:Uncharacterized protein n=1 Tax=Paraburkholderia rhizosphaerae TaxID=480658 RepID=A0A4R8LK03_9BURK|nr:hypothetical protein [Paraburkholderia rhizosphaerae]TDY44475.1 hypothetical protein BX592_116123 [Paraburkholderia rhizosphaerae]
MEDSTDETSNQPSRFASRLIKILLFVGLYLLAVLFVSTGPFPMTVEHMRWWTAFSAKWGIRDPAGSWVSVTLALDLVVTILVYLLIAKRVAPLASEISITPPVLARRIVKTMLFVSLFGLIGDFVFDPMQPEYTRWWSNIAGKLGVRDPKALETPVALLVDLVLTTLAYMAIVKSWRICKTRLRSNRPA